MLFRCLGEIKWSDLWFKWRDPRSLGVVLQFSPNLPIPGLNPLKWFTHPVITHSH